MRRLKVNPVVMRLCGIVLFSLLFGEMGFIGFVGISMIRFNAIRFWTGWNYHTPDTLFAIWRIGSNLKTQRFYLIGFIWFLLVINILARLEWFHAMVAYTVLSIGLVLIEQVVVIFYLRKVLKQLRGTSFEA